MEADRRQLVQARKALEDGLRKLHHLQQQVIQEAEGQLVDLAVQIARKVLMQEIQAGRYEIDPIVKEALQHAPAHRDVVVHLHPDDWSRCRMAGQDEESANAGAPAEASGFARATPDKSAKAGNVGFVADAGVPRAECVLETVEGIVTSSVETHLEDVADALKVSE